MRRLRACGLEVPNYEAEADAAAESDVPFRGCLVTELFGSFTKQAAQRRVWGGPAGLPIGARGPATPASSLRDGVIASGRTAATRADWSIENIPNVAGYGRRTFARINSPYSASSSSAVVPGFPWSAANSVHPPRESAETLSGTSKAPMKHCDRQYRIALARTHSRQFKQRRQLRTCERQLTKFFDGLPKSGVVAPVVLSSTAHLHVRHAELGQHRRARCGGYLLGS